jgi:hypothetical protein
LNVRGDNGITWETQSSGVGGDLRITTGSLLFDEVNAHIIGLYADTSNEGQAGSIHIRVNDIVLHNDAHIATETSGSEDRGDVVLLADSL